MTPSSLHPGPADDAPARFPIDLAAIRERLDRRQGPAFWRGLEELADDAGFREFLAKEYPRHASDWDESLDRGFSRRRFLELGMASMALAGMTACTRQPVEKIVPYVKQPEEIVPGVPSFCASAAVLNIPLCENDQELHIIPGTYSPTEALAYPGVKVFMKNNLPETLAAARERNLSVRMVENCGTPDQHVYRSLGEMPENTGYYSLVIVKEDGQ